MSKTLFIPLGDDAEAQAKVRSLAGSAAANERKNQLDSPGACRCSYPRQAVFAL